MTARISMPVALVAVSIAAFQGHAWAQSPVPDTAAVNTATTAFFKALSARDIDAIAPLWAQTAYVADVSPLSQGVAVGWTAARQDIVASFTGLAQFSVAFSQASMNVAGDSAWVVGTSKVHLVVQNGPTMDYTAFDTLIFERQAGKWLIVAHVASPVSPPPGPPPAK